MMPRKRGPGCLITLPYDEDDELMGAKSSATDLRLLHNNNYSAAAGNEDAHFSTRDEVDFSQSDRIYIQDFMASGDPINEGVKPGGKAAKQACKRRSSMAESGLGMGSN